MGTPGTASAGTDGVSSSGRLSATGWLVCVIAAIGFAFDIYELLMLPLIIKPAIANLSKPIVESLVQGGMAPADAMALWSPGGTSYVGWARTLFFVPAIAGGVFGLLGGYLTDVLGRRRVLTFSMRWRLWRLDSRPLCRSCSFSAALFLLVCASSLWRPWHGWQSFFQTASSVNELWAGRKRFPRWAVCSSVQRM